MAEGRPVESGAQAATPRVHLTSRQAGEIAAACRARRLLLTHFWPGNDRGAAWRAAAEVYDGEVRVAEEGAEIRLP